MLHIIKEMVSLKVEEIQEEHKQLEEKIGGMVRKTIARVGNEEYLLVVYCSHW